MSKVDSVTAGPSGSRYNSAAERWAEQKRLVSTVIAGYKAVCDLSPIVAFNPDESCRSRSNKWSPDSCHYKVDVELCVRRAIDGRPEPERPALWEAWQKMLNDEDDGNMSKDAQRLIRLLSGPFFTKRLHPRLYFKPSPRHGSRRTA